MEVFLLNHHIFSSVNMSIKICESVCDLSCGEDVGKVGRELNILIDYSLKYNAADLHDYLLSKPNDVHCTSS